MLSATKLLTPDEAATRYGYTSTRAFLRAARSSGLPRVRLNARVIRFDPARLAEFDRKKAS